MILPDPDEEERLILATDRYLWEGKTDGTCFVRYDNEKGKGDHRHQADGESPYPFRDIGSLLSDFMNDINKL